MKRTITFTLAIVLASCLFNQKAQAQSIAQLLQQLSLDYQKLAGLKNILSQMYTGYEVLKKGYNSVKDVSKGNFNLHEAFLDGLLIVSPAVRQYPRVRDIIDDQSAIISEYHAAYSSFRQDKHFNPDEVSYMATVYNNLVAASLKNINDLSTVMNDNKLRMSDSERLAAIDRIYTDGHGQLAFLRKFNDQNYRTTFQRARDAGDEESIKSLYNVN